MALANTKGVFLLLVALVLPAAVLSFSSGNLIALKRAGTPAGLCLRKSSGLAASVCRPELRSTRVYVRAGEGKAEGEEGAAASEVVEEGADLGSLEDPFEGLDLDSKEFLQRKVEILEKELAQATARVSELETDAAAVQPLVDRGVVKSTNSRELVDTYFRLAADFDNFRRRAEVNLVQARDSATGDIVKQLLTILDNFERAASNIKTETDREASINNSYQSVGKEMLKALTKLGVEPIEPLGQPFDPNFHNAINQAESTEYAEGVVSQSLQRGYKIATRVVRPAMCVVSAGPGPQAGAQAAPADVPPADAPAA